MFLVFVFEAPGLGQAFLRVSRGIPSAKLTWNSNSSCVHRAGGVYTGQLVGRMLLRALTPEKLLCETAWRQASRSNLASSVRFTA